MENKPLKLYAFAQRYGICTKTAGRWLRKFKDLKAMKIGKMFYVPLKALEEWEKNRCEDFQKVYRPKEII